MKWNWKKTSIKYLLYFLTIGSCVSLTTLLYSFIMLCKNVIACFKFWKTNINGTWPILLFIYLKLFAQKHFSLFISLMSEDIGLLYGLLPEWYRRHSLLSTQQNVLSGQVLKLFSGLAPKYLGSNPTFVCCRIPWNIIRASKYLEYLGCQVLNAKGT